MVTEQATSVHQTDRCAWFASASISGNVSRVQSSAAFKGLIKVTSCFLRPSCGVQALALQLLIRAHQVRRLLSRAAYLESLQSPPQLLLRRCLAHHQLQHQHHLLQAQAFSISVAHRLQPAALACPLARDSTLEQLQAILSHLVSRCDRFWTRKLSRLLQL